jgi:hypothetical protein
MTTQNTIFVEIENYIRDFISKNGGFFNRDIILNASKEWMEKYPVEFNSILNLIENEGKSDEMMDDSVPSVAFGGRYADDSVPSVAFCSRIDDDSTPSVAHHDEYSGNIMPDHISYVMNSPMGSDNVDSSPGGYQDEDYELYTPLQRTMSSDPFRK